MLMSIHRLGFLTCLVVMATWAGRAADQSEHVRVARRVVDSLLLDCEARISGQELRLPGDSTQRFPFQLIGSSTFVDLSGAFAEDDMARSRFHERGRTILEQLTVIDRITIEESFRLAGTTSIGALKTDHTMQHSMSVVRANSNVVANYLLSHLVALQFAEIAGKDPSQQTEAMRQALTFEVLAQSYLVDTFCAGHILVPSFDAFHWAHTMNIRKAHDFYNVAEGAYVINSKHEVWQTFGDQLLEWYAPTFGHVVQAAVTSARELMLTYFVSKDTNQIPSRLRRWGLMNASGHTLTAMVEQWLSKRDGRWYYESAMMPTLLELPMPVSAAWSRQSDHVSQHKIHDRLLYPQLREAESHDPDEDGIDKRFLYSAAAIPTWMRFEMNSAPALSIRNDPRIASVRYIQERDYPPSYIGTLGHLRAAHDFKSGSMAYSFGAGYGLLDEFLFLQNLSPDLVVMHSQSAWFLSATGGLSLSLPLGVVSGARLESGYVWGLGSSAGVNGWTGGFGLESKVFPFGFTYAGTTLRLMYRHVRSVPAMQSVSLEVVLQ